jgi:hypothetical protein
VYLNIVCVGLSNGLVDLLKFLVLGHDCSKSVLHNKLRASHTQIDNDRQESIVTEIDP